MVMDWINQGASALNSGIDAVVHYISQNGVAIGFILVIAYFVRSSGKLCCVTVRYDLLLVCGRWKRRHLC